jgi:hypothetical protein
MRAKAALNVIRGDNAAILHVDDFAGFFWMALSGVIGRYFGSITLWDAAMRLFLRGFSARRYRRYGCYRGLRNWNSDVGARSSTGDLIAHFQSARFAFA